MRSSLARLLFLVCVLLLPRAAAQDDLAAFKKERAADELKNLPATALSAADALAARAEASAKAGNAAAAARLAREARWLLPARPLGLPDHVEAVLGYGRLRHGDRVNAVAYSRDGKWLASASRDGTVRVWDLGNGREAARYAGFPDAPELATAKEKGDVLKAADVAFAPDGETLFAAGGAEVHRVEWKTGKLVTRFKGSPRSVKSVAVSPDGAVLVTGGDDNVVRLWDAKTGKETTAFPPQPARIEGVAVSPNGKLVAAVDDDGNLCVYPADGAGKKPILDKVKVTDGGNRAVKAVVFTPDSSKVLTTGGADNSPRLTTVPSQPATVLKFAGHSSAVTGVAISDDGKAIVSSSDDGTVRAFDATAGRQIRQFEGHRGNVLDVAIRPDGKQVASAGEDGTVRVYDLAIVDEHRTSADATDSVWAAAFGPDGAKFATGGADRSVRVYDTQSGKLDHTFTGHAGAVTAVAFVGPDRLASAGGDKKVRLWDLKEGKPAGELSGPTSAVLAVAAFEDGRVVAGSVDKTVRVWDAAGKAGWTWTGQSAVAAVAVRKGGKEIAVGTADGGLTILDVSGPEPRVKANLPAHIAGVAAVAYSATGDDLATAGGDGVAKLWNATMTPPGLVRAHEPPGKPTPGGAAVALSAVGFTPDGKQLLAAGAEGVIRLWSTMSGAEVRTLRGHTDWVTAAVVAPDSDRLLSAAVDKSARLFELPRAATVIRSGHLNAAKTAAISRDGKTVVTAAADRSLKVWNPAGGPELKTIELPGLPTAVAFLAPDKVVCTVREGKVRIALLAGTAAELKDVQPGDAHDVYAVAAAANGGKFGVWSRVGKDDHFTVFAADGTPAPNPLIDKEPFGGEKERSCDCAAFSGDLSLVATASDGRVRLWNVADRKRLGDDWKLDDSTADLGITPDAKTLLLVNKSGKVTVADIEKRKAVATADSVGGEVAGLVVSPTGDRFAVVSAEGEVKAFDLAGKPVRAWKLPVGVSAAAFAADGKRLVTANADGTAYVLALP